MKTLIEKLLRLITKSDKKEYIDDLYFYVIRRNSLDYKLDFGALAVNVRISLN